MLPDANGFDQFKTIKPEQYPWVSAYHPGISPSYDSRVTSHQSPVTTRKRLTRLNNETRN
jgi:hypothetical protein